MLLDLITIIQTVALGHTASTAYSAWSSITSRDTWITCLSAFTFVGYNSIRWVPCKPEYECTWRSATPIKYTNNQSNYWMTQNC